MEKRYLPELLCPAGDYEALLGAICGGADAVYFGSGNFNARRNAGNFDGDKLGEAIADRVGHESIDITYRYAHLFPDKQGEMADRLDDEWTGKEGA